MILRRTPLFLYIQREVGDVVPRTESRLMYHVKRAIIRTFGLDCVKKLARKDGHLVGDDLYYVRARKGEWCVWDSQHCVRSPLPAYNRGEEVRLNWQDN
jgi:hypothetical protein